MPNVIQVSDKIADAVGLRIIAAKQKDLNQEYPQVGTRLAWAKKKGTKAQQKQRVPIYRKTNRKLLAQIAFVKGGKTARDAIYPMRHSIFV